MLFIGVVFIFVFASEMREDCKLAPRRGRTDPGRQEDEAYKASKRATISIGTKVVNCKRFLSMVLISYSAKSGTSHFMAWIEKAVGEHDKAVKQAKGRGASHCGPTPLSRLVSYKCNQLRQEMVDMFKAEFDEEHFGPVWELLPASQHASARRLIASLLLIEIASWDFRLVLKLDTMPYILLIVPDTPPHCENPRRKQLARSFLASSPNQLAKMSMRSDIPEKLKDLFKDEFEVMAVDGRCPLSLYLFCEILRMRMPCESQEVEGFNSVIQRMSWLAFWEGG